ncbi:ABC transporter ATP-binding protein [Rhodomicrobium sp. Az07]|nr:ABC transporter ATP-binding protein [Rhodomicrobium sp. Az07]MBT3071260.1 ABC transporter ATP-binding protein [Rhodomicrobium sp. Az07]
MNGAQGEAPLLLEARDVCFRYAGREVLKRASLGIGAGEIVSLLGANGAGKSTLLRVVLGLAVPSAGEVLTEAVPLQRLSRREIAKRIAYVPQVHAAPFPYTVRDVVLMGRLPDSGAFRSASARDREMVAEVLDRIGIAFLADRVYTEISGGERQLTLIARALAQEPRVLVLDEPMSGLDYGYQAIVADRLRDLAADGRAILMSTHDPHFAMEISSRIALLERGRIEADGTPRHILTVEAIRELYHVDVECFDLPNGHRTFVRVPKRRSRS